MQSNQTIVALNNCVSPSTLNNSHGIVVWRRDDFHVTTLGEMVPSGDSRRVTGGLHSTLNNNWHMKGVYYPLIFGIILLVAASRWVRVHFLLLLLLRRPGLHNKSCLPPPGTWSHRTPGCGWWPTSTWPSSAPRSRTSGSTWLPWGSCPLSHPWWSPGKEGVWTFGLSLGAAVWRREAHNSRGGRLVI